MNATRVGADAGEYIRVVHAGTCARGGIDLVAVERAVNGEHTPLSGAEKVYAARLLRDRGLVVRAIGARLGVSHPTVLVWLNGGKR
ncbi:hypothetical protein ABTY20_19180 [Streptomyces sp. NPDC126497]|uniref:hypothetical protein n=1 Tax=Streptomyces sp. NPDC126497 TaxID=3155313 RepID=UPI0033201476